jgi:hypothetical protein
VLSQRLAWGRWGSLLLGLFRSTPTQATLNIPVSVAITGGGSYRRLLGCKWVRPVGIVWPAIALKPCCTMHMVSRDIPCQCASRLAKPVAGRQVRSCKLSTGGGHVRCGHLQQWYVKHNAESHGRMIISRIRDFCPRPAPVWYQVALPVLIKAPVPWSVQSEAVG